MSTDKFEICLAHTLRKADRVVSQLYNEHLATVGIKVTQFPVLRAIYLMGSITASQIQVALVMDQTTVSRALKPLIRDGYITAEEGETKREKLLTLTREGRALYKRALGPWNDAQKRLKSKLGEGNGDLLIALSQQIVG